ncbi:MAG TPA: trypsin-like peptidase domain-containing protein [Sandaracinaceae bacterium LLY-WYZ-13_1]|nr:trypsin-like peptidase domain-containing protein [Sandaracinaceae bacterium LLY-WYZ-13_1]
MPAARHSRRTLRTLAATVGLGAALTLGVAAAETLGADASAQDAEPPAPSASGDATGGRSLASARALGDAFSEVASRVSPSVVSVRVEAQVPGRRARTPFGPRRAPNDGVARGHGSGVVIRPDGYILTNNHVVQHAVRLEVELQDGRRFDARVVGTDPATDLAVLRVDARGLTAAPFASPDRVRPGQWAIAIGSPFGLDYSVTTGVVSSVGRGGLGMNEIEDYIQTDASINPGNSGGPLVDLDGRVIGINTMIIGRGSGIGFAVSAELAQRVAGQIIEHGRVRRPWIGVQFQALTPELASAFALGDRGRAGALIADVVSGGPAERSGLRPGDVVVEVDGEPVSEARDLLRAVLRHDVGSNVGLEVIRAGRRHAVVLRAAERPVHAREDAPTPSEPEAAPNGSPAEGLGLRPLSRGEQRQLGGPGALVTGVRRGSDAHRAGLRPGDVLVEADGRAVSRPDDVARALRDDRALLRVRRGDGAMYVVLED